MRHPYRTNEIKSLRRLCASAYQALGALDGPVPLLDNLRAAASGEVLPHATDAGLPVVLDSHSPDRPAMDVPDGFELAGWRELPCGHQIYHEAEARSLYGSDIEPVFVRVGK